MKATAERLIEQEMRRMKRVERSELPLNIDLFETDEILKKEIERIQKKQPLEALDTQRYVLQGPEDENDLEGWKKAVNNSKAQLESQAGRYYIFVHYNEKQLRKLVVFSTWNYSKNMVLMLGECITIN